MNLDRAAEAYLPARGGVTMDCAAAGGASGVTVAILSFLSRMCRSPVISMTACRPVAPISFRASTR
jgi:hypothetical protein